MIQEELVAATYLRKAESEVLESKELSLMYQKLEILPGFGAVTALTVLLELGDYTRFRSAEAIAKFCGVVPKAYESGQIKSKGHINRHSNKYLRVALYNTSAVLINRCQRDSDLGEFAYRQAKVRK
jgi:transposase